MPMTSTLLDQAHNALERKLCAMKGNRSGIENLGLALQSRHGIPCHYGNIACPTARHLGADPA
jgi:hypothetical protein